MKPMDDSELRQLLKEYTAINDNYVKCLATKDTKILSMQRTIDELELQVETLTKAMFPELPVGAEVSQ